MGYEVYIVRQNDYDNGDEESNIPIQEWLDYVATDSELKLTNGYQTRIPGFSDSWLQRPGFSEWLGHPDYKIGTIPWFDYGSGCISAKYPDNATICKMIIISQSLNAKVRGDDFEYYDESFFTTGKNSLDLAADQELNKSSIDKPQQRPWWKFW